MEANYHTVCLVVTADQEFFNRVELLCREEGRTRAIWITDPAILNLTSTGHEGKAPLFEDICGVVIDLTSPRSYSGESVRGLQWSEDEAINAWYIVALLAMARCADKIPMLVVSSFTELRHALRRAGVPITEHLLPNANTDAWRLALCRLLAAEHGLPIASPAAQHRSNTTLIQTFPVHTSSVVQLHSNIWFDAECSILYLAEGRIVQLTAREVSVLEILAKSPGRYFTSHELASRLTARDPLYPVEEHSIEQTICGLRRKLGESAKCPRLILNRRKLGYTLLPFAKPTMPNTAHPEFSIAVANAKNLNET